MAAEKDLLVTLWLVELSTRVTVGTVHEATEGVVAKTENVAAILLGMASVQHRTAPVS